MLVKIASWNVNSINQRLQHLTEWVEAEKIDVLLLQEIKCTENNFPHLILKSLGFHIALNTQKAFNGVAILSKYPIEVTHINLPDFVDESARYIEAKLFIQNKYIRAASVYIPNGKAVHSPSFLYKLKFFESFSQHLYSTYKKEEIFLIGGDYNVAPEPIDVYDAKRSEGKIGFHIEERQNFRKIINLGFYDAFRLLHPSSIAFSWWDYRRRAFLANDGMRLDTIILSPEAADKLTSASIVKALRQKEKPSDHAPVLIELDV